MILSTEHHNIAPIFGIFFVFWAVVLLVLWFSIGFLLKRHDELLQKHKTHDDEGH